MSGPRLMRNEDTFWRVGADGDRCSVSWGAVYDYREALEQLEREKADPANSRYTDFYIERFSHLTEIVREPDLDVVLANLDMTTDDLDMGFDHVRAREYWHNTRHYVEQPRESE